MYVHVHPQTTVWYAPACMHALWDERACSLVPRRGEFSVWERDYSAMCGIFASIHKRCGKENLLKVLDHSLATIVLRWLSLCQAALLERLKRRGPDLTKEASIPLSGGILELYLLGTLLRMRGGITPQPLANGSGDYLVWNGNVFGGEIQVLGLATLCASLVLQASYEVPVIDEQVNIGLCLVLEFAYQSDCSHYHLY